MKKLALSLGIILFGIIAGQVVKYLQKGKTDTKTQKTSNMMNKIRLLAFLIFNPVVLINAYWIVDFSSITMLVVPFICLTVLAVGGIVALFASKILKHNNKQKSAMFGCGTFSNLGTIGGLITLIFLGDEAYTIAALYFVFESFYNYLFAYPMVKGIAEGKGGEKSSLLKIFKDPSIITYVGSIFVGLGLNFSGLERPNFMTAYNTFMVPTVSFMLTFAISYKMEFQKIKSSIPEGMIAILIKYIISPIVAVSIGYAFGLQHIADGLVIKVLLIMSLVPCGFNSILTPTIYKSDKDVANSVWIMNMVALLVVIPLEYIFLVL